MLYFKRNSTNARFIRARDVYMMASTALSTAFLITAGLPSSVLAQTAASSAPALEEVIVTGSKIIREGYEAPTPLSVIDAAKIENKPDSNLAITIAEMPAFAGGGGAVSNNGGLSSSTSGQSNLNMRGLGAARTLVLLDGQRTVGSSASGQNVDISSYPQQLVSRVDVVTGGASSVYGSDAVSGVVNFILDKTFTGIKGEISSGLTVYGDAKNYAIKLSAGFPFAGNRGHVLLSGSEEFNEGTDGDGGRPWDNVSYQVMQNPLYGTGVGQSTTVPYQLALTNVGVRGATPGGVVNSGPLRGVYFGEGGKPGFLNTGDLVSESQFHGGDWKYSDVRQEFGLAQKDHRQNAFLRVQYDVTENVTGFIQSSFTTSHQVGKVSWPYRLDSNGVTIKIDNAYLPVSVRDAMTLNKVTTIRVGSWNVDMGIHGANNLRVTNQNYAGLEGNFDAAGTNWKWNANASYGISRPNINFNNTFVLANFALANDAVVNPATGAIVCRIKLTDPSSPCQPWNILGTNVNGQNAAGLDYIQQGNSNSKNKVEQTVFEIGLAGEPITLPAGPVSVALSAAHRIDKVLNRPDVYSVAIGHNVANLPVLDGKQSVSEGALETVIPIASGKPWAENWDFNGAARFTSYQYAGDVITWKAGSTYSVIPDFKLRVTKSRDIRAPNLQELFQPSAFSLGVLTDPFTNTKPSVNQFNTGNTALKPEKADTVGLGIVLIPTFLEDFTASIDYWNVDIAGAIGSISSQTVIDLCFNNTRPDLCSNIVRVNGVINKVTRQNININSQDMRGLDVESTYKFELPKIDGDFTAHANATFYLKNYEFDGISASSNRVGENGGANIPDWRLTVSGTYKLDALTSTLTARAVSGGTVNSQWIECSTSCPVSKAPNLTINDNHMAGAVYLDANINYDFNVGEANTTAFFAVKNIFNRDPELLATTANYGNLATGVSGLYDVMGTTFRAGLRFKM
jgi:iron complex outermembrane recepter protein